jgi:3-phosphoshikimate 1-carboxyvinyltransferase
LIQLGPRIDYLENEGFPPLKIFGSHLHGGIIELDGSISSQYISALLMIAPTLDRGLTLRLKNRITSRSYIELTLKLMESAGIKYYWKNNEIRINEQVYQPVEFQVEADWSAAGYWYEILALSSSGEIKLDGLRLSGLQGDEAIAHWFDGFGIETIASGSGIIIRKKQESKPSRLFLKFHENPDVAQTMAVLCVAKGIPFHFSGLETLKIKETNRIAALQTELAKFGAVIMEPGEGELKWDGKTDASMKLNEPVIDTYNDHRMAMAFAPMSILGTPVIVNNPGVVSKSYPGFWEDLQKVGFLVQQAP